MRPEHTGGKEEALGAGLDPDALPTSSSSSPPSSSSTRTDTKDLSNHNNGGGLLQQAFDAYHRYARDEDHLVRDSALQTVLADHGVPMHEVLHPASSKSQFDFL